MSKYIFYDRFENEYTTKRDPFAPKERYFIVWRGTIPKFFVENYEENGRRFGMSYTQDMRDACVVENERQYNYEKYGFNNPRLISLEMPPSEFDKILHIEPLDTDAGGEND